MIVLPGFTFSALPRQNGGVRNTVSRQSIGNFVLHWQQHGQYRRATTSGRPPLADDRFLHEAARHFGALRGEAIFASDFAPVGCGFPALFHFLEAAVCVRLSWMTQLVTMTISSSSKHGRASASGRSAAGSRCTAASSRTWVMFMA
jgi:hypothetical protein